MSTLQETSQQWFENVFNKNILLYNRDTNMNNIKDIRQTIAEWTYNLGSLCRSSKLNKWSEHKPINSPKMTRLTDTDYYNANCGFNIWSFNQPQLMLNELQNPNTHLWEYIEREAPYRLSDFLEYNHEAQPYFELSFIGLNTGTAGDTLHIDITGDLQHVINEYAAYRSYTYNSDLVLLIYPQGTSYDDSGMQSVGIYKVSAWIDFDGERISFLIPQGLSVGDYTLVPCLTTATGSKSDGEYYYYNPNSETLSGLWFPLCPHSKINFSVTQTSPNQLDFFQLFDFSEFEGVDFTYTSNNFELRDITFTNYAVYAPYNSTRQFSVILEYYYTNCSQPVLLGQAHRTFNAENILETINVNYRDTIYVKTNAQLQDDIISIEVRAYITSNGEQQTKKFNYSVEKTQ